MIKTTANLEFMFDIAELKAMLGEEPEVGDLEEYIHDYLCSLIEEKGTAVFINWQNMVKEIAKIIK